MRAAQKQRDEPPQPSHRPPSPHTTPPAMRGEAGMLQSGGDQRGHGRAANPPTSLGPPQLTPILWMSLGGGWTPLMVNKAHGERCETLPSFPLLHQEPLMLTMDEVVPRGLQEGLQSWDPPSPRDLHGLLLVGSKPWSVEGFSNSPHLPTV